jgi:uncharacterized protein YjbI with pentapeptide repeats
MKQLERVLRAAARGGGRLLRILALPLLLLPFLFSAVVVLVVVLHQWLRKPARRLARVWSVGARRVARPVLLLLTAAGFIVLLVACVLFFPTYIVDRDLGASATSPTPAELVKAKNEVRTTLLQGLGGLFLIATTYFTWRQLHHSREGQITERFNKAIEHLGRNKKKELDIRLGGIHALDRLGRDSKSDRAAIIDILAAYVREYAPWLTPAAHSQTSELPTLQTRAPDVQAALDALTRRALRHGHEERVELEKVDLRRAYLKGAYLKGTYLKGTYLKGAHLEGAHLEGAYLEDAHLEDAHLRGAHLEGAYLRGAHLEGAHLEDSSGNGAEFWSAHLEGAHLEDAHLRGAQLGGAHLGHAQLGDAHLEGAHLRGAHLEGASLLRAHLRRADLERANLSGADLSLADLGHADLTDANLAGARLTEAHLQDANLRGANLAGAYLVEADLTGASLKGATLYGARCNQGTRWPVGFDPRAEGAESSD